jgi:pimeloyl-ACP methyl ester carboxylesterase
MNKYIYYSLSLIFSLLIISCSKDNDPGPPQDEEILVTATLVDSKTASELQFLVQLSGQVLDPAFFKYDVNLYKVTYKTSYKEDQVIASGLVALPVTREPVEMVSFQHGTILQYGEAPSVKDEDSFDVVVYEAAASTGFITLVPDYLGFGESKNIFHPYYVEKATADAVTDLIQAAQELALTEEINFTEKLFLAGYSQGGYATLAAHKAIEQEPLQNVDLIASFPAAGGYDIKAVQEYFFDLQEYEHPYYMAYIAKSYQTYYNHANLISDFFNEPYATRIPTLLNGMNSQSFINDQLTTNIAALVKADVLANIDTNPSYAYLVNAFEENSLTDWVPTKKIFFYHGNADTTVPYDNSVLTFQKLTANGTSPGLLQLITLEGADHNTGVEPYIADVIKKLQELK